MSGHVKRLEAAGWVVKAEDADDGRRTGLAVTDAGETRLDDIRRLRNDWLSSRLAKLSEEDRRKLAEAVDPLLDLLSVSA